MINPDFFALYHKICVSLQRMRLVRRPWIWLSRFRHRRGYGVHSPFAYTFIRDVALERSQYYAYDTLAKLHPWWVRWFGLYPLTCRRLLFRVANYVHPQAIRVIGGTDIENRYLQAAVPSATITDKAADFVYVSRNQQNEAQDIAASMPSNGVMVVEGIHADSKALNTWHQIQADDHTGISFDLYTYGIVFFDQSRHKQQYIVNF